MEGLYGRWRRTLPGALVWRGSQEPSGRTLTGQASEWRRSDSLAMPPLPPRRALHRQYTAKQDRASRGLEADPRRQRSPASSCANSAISEGR